MRFREPEVFSLLTPSTHMLHWAKTISLLLHNNLNSALEDSLLFTEFRIAVFTFPKPKISLRYISNIIDLPRMMNDVDLLRG